MSAACQTWEDHAHANAGISARYRVVLQEHHESYRFLISTASTEGMDDESCAGCGRLPDDHTNKELAACLGKVFDEFKEAYEKNTGA